jgi:hypothetical protein
MWRRRRWRAGGAMPPGTRLWPGPRAIDLPSVGPVHDMTAPTGELAAEA